MSKAREGDIPSLVRGVGGGGPPPRKCLNFELSLCVFNGGFMRL